MAQFTKKNKPLTGTKRSRRRFKATKVVTEVKPKMTHEDEVAAINQMIDDTAQRLKQNSSEVQLPTMASFHPDPSQFNGINGDQEEFKVVQNEIAREQRQAARLEERLKIIQADNEKEKKDMAEEIRELKQELHRTKPLHDNALFSLTRELRQTVGQMDQLMQDTPMPEPATVVSTGGMTNPPPPPLSLVPISPPTEPRQVVKTNPPPDQPANNQTLPPKSKKKLAVTASVVIFILIGTSLVLSQQVIKQPEVDQQLVSEYLVKQQGGEVAGTQTTVPTSTANTSTKEDEQKKLTAEIPFEQTIWETVKDPVFGVQVQFPANVSVFLKSDSNLTFLRHDGYIFKIQKVETALEPKDYWQQVKTSSLNYQDSERSFLNRDALYLELDDVTDFPGNRYLVKEGDFIYDIWYATPSQTFSEADSRRAEYMLNSFSLTDNEN